MTALQSCSLKTQTAAATYYKLKTEKEVLPVQLKAPLQPLVFCFSGVSHLCTAVARLYDFYPQVKASLCLYDRKYYLAVHSKLKMRRKVFRLLVEFGSYLGPGSVTYAFYEEHGKNISDDAVSELGAAFREHDITE